MAGVDKVFFGVAKLGFAFDPFDDRAIEFVRSAALADARFKFLAELFDFNAVVDGISKRLPNRSNLAQIARVPVAGQLEAGGTGALFEDGHEGVTVLAGAFADVMGQNQLGVSVNGQIAVKLAALRVFDVNEVRAASDGNGLSDCCWHAPLKAKPLPNERESAKNQQCHNCHHHGTKLSPCRLIHKGGALIQDGQYQG